MRLESTKLIKRGGGGGLGIFCYWKEVGYNIGTVKAIKGKGSSVRRFKYIETGQYETVSQNVHLRASSHTHTGYGDHLPIQYSAMLKVSGGSPHYRRGICDSRAPGFTFPTPGD